MDLADVMDEIAAQLDTIPDLNCFGWPAPRVTPPAAVVSYPETYTFDGAYGRGIDSLTLPVVVVVGKASERSARDQLAAYCDGSGPRSVKAVLEAGSYDEFDSLRVASIDFDVVTIGATDYVAAIFSLEIVGPGA